VNSDFRISVTFPDHPKTLALARSAGITAPYRLILLWAWVATHRPDGDLSGIPDEDLEAVMHWHGERIPIVSALVDAGFIDGETEHRRVHNWKYHNGYASTAKQRQQIAKLAGQASGEKRRSDALNRLSKASNPSSTDSSTRVRTDSSTRVRTPSPSPSPSPYPHPRHQPMRTPTSEPDLPLDQASGDTPDPGADPTDGPLIVRRKGKPVNGQDGEALRAFDRFHRSALQGSPYRANMARDRKIMRNLIGLYGLDRTIEMIDAFFREQSEPTINPLQIRPVHQTRPDVVGFANAIPHLHKLYQWESKLCPTPKENRDA